MAEKNKTIVLLVSTMVLVILGIAFLTSIADQTVLNTEKTRVIDESYNLTSLGCMQGGQVNGSTDVNCNLTVTYPPAGWEQTDTDCYLSSVVVSNYTGTALTLDTDYNLNTQTGLISMLNTTSTTATALGAGGIVYVDYQHCGDGYLSDSWGRSVLNTNVGLFVIAILIAVVLVVYLLFGKNKDDD